MPGAGSFGLKLIGWWCYEGFSRIEDSIGREKQIKGGSRRNKMLILNTFNPEWKDLFEEVMEH